MTGYIPLDHVLKVADDWEDEVKERRKISPVDPVADTLNYCAADIRERIRLAAAQSRTVNTFTYAAIHNTSAATVRKWITRGELQATRDDKGEWRIPVNATRTRRRRTA